MNKRVTQAAFARICDVNRSTVSRWIKNGRIERGDDGLIDAAAAHKMREATESPLPHHQARKVQIETEKAAGETEHGKGESDDRPRADEIGRRLKYATMKEREAKAEMAEMERDRQAGDLVDRSDIDFVLEDFGQTLRGMLEGLPDRLSPALAAHRGDVAKIHSDLEGVARDLLNEISGHTSRRMDAMKG